MIIEDWVAYSLTTEELEKLIDKQAQIHEREMQDLEQRLEKLENYHGTRCYNLPAL